jgi:hypothetical protein
MKRQRNQYTAVIFIFSCNLFNGFGINFCYFAFKNVIEMIYLLGIIGKGNNDKFKKKKLLTWHVNKS